MKSFSSSIANPAQMSIEDMLMGSDISSRDEKRLGEGYKRVFNLMKDGFWRTPEQIASGSSTRLDTALRMLRYAKQRGHLYFKRLVKNGLYEYKIISQHSEL